MSEGLKQIPWPDCWELGQFLGFCLASFYLCSLTSTILAHHSITYSLKPVSIPKHEGPLQHKMMESEDRCCK